MLTEKTPQNGGHWAFISAIFSGGHAITPYAVEDQGDGIFHVYVYDNNYPNLPRIMEINRDAETWSYEAPPIPA
ncbi:MAG: hypothetical protein M5U34_30985 [Chloroflexi bacterium]|nr:hypothetical protein [Chloroflexota bacterium]